MTRGQDLKIHVAGHRGLAGSSITRTLHGRGYRNLALPTHEELDLADRAAVRRFYETERPDHVYLAAAKVGGILANIELPADFVYQNLVIQNNVIEEARRAGVRRLLFLGSVCIYPRDCPQPIREEHLLTGPLEFTNRPYAVAKIAGIEMCWAYNRQYGTRYLAAMPNNLYGPGDNYHPQHSHVLPSLIRKFHEAKAGKGKVLLWGTGTPRREMLFSDDMADACVTLMELPDAAFDRVLATDEQPPRPPLINIGWGEDYTIRELAEQVREVVGFRGEVEWDAGKPDGTPRKLLDASRMNALGWKPRIRLEDGLKRTYEDFLSRYAIR
jgi:GDP-L-fucose synthase